MEHTIWIEAEREEDLAACEELLRRAIAAALEEEGVAVPCEISVLLTDEAGIQAINRDQRGVDQPTDVLSFPMFDLVPGEPPAEESAETDPETGLFPLGDMAISLPRARAQAEEYGHPLSRELAYLAVHSVLHLLGYDHLDEGEEKRRMRAHEEAVMDRLGLAR